MSICYIPPSTVFTFSFPKLFVHVFNRERVNGIPLWDFYPSDFQRALKIITVVELFIVITTSPGLLRHNNNDSAENAHSRSYVLKPGLHIVGRIVSMCLRPCPKKHVTAPQVSIAKISCERLLLSKTCVTTWKNCLLMTPIILTASVVHG